MRTISAASLLKLAQRTGTEPLTIIEIEWEWDGPRFTYGDKITPGVDGRILTVSAFDDIINMSTSGVSQSINFVLSDHDGHLKYVFDTVDLQKKRVWVYQWFTGIPLSEKVLLFRGGIESPISWNEGDRSLTFSVVSQADGEEVGFSPEEGTFPGLPDNLVGQAWPLCFGSPLKIPAILIDDLASGGSNSSGGSGGSAPMLDEAIGMEDPSLKHQIKDHDIKRDFLLAQAKLYFIGYLQASYTARRRGEIGELESLSASKGGTFVGLAKSYLSAGNKALVDAQKINTKNSEYKSIKAKQKSYEKTAVKIRGGEKYPQNKTVRVNIGGSIYTGFFSGSNFTITSASHPSADQYSGMEVLPLDQRSGEPVIVRSNFFYADVGTPIKMGASLGLDVEDDNVVLPVRYVVAATLQVTVNAVFARRDFNGVSDIYQVPSNYYSVYQLNFGTLPVTLLFFPQPLSTRMTGGGGGPSFLTTTSADGLTRMVFNTSTPVVDDAEAENEGWQDDIWVNVTSPVGPNPVDIITWLINKYTTDSIDLDSFTATRAFLSGDPANFALTDRPNVLSLIADIAYQTRSIVWMKNGVYHMKYLPFKTAPVATITESDILEQSLSVVYTETADLVTKYKAEWKVEGNKSKSNLIIIRFNIPKYGLIEKSYNYYIFNMSVLVQRSATFWMIRTSNTYKRVICTVPISKLNIESLDIVTLNFTNNFIAWGPIDCLVESAILDTGEYTVQLTLWCPVRAGEMTEYMFAFPAGLAVEYVYPSQSDVQKGRVASRTDTNENVRMPTPAQSPRPEIANPITGQSNSGSVNVSYRPLTWGSNDLNQLVDRIAPEINTRIDAGMVSGSGIKPAGTTKYAYEKAIIPEKTFVEPGCRTVPAYITGPGDGETNYNVRAYFKGIDAAPTAVKNVRVLQLNNDDDDEFPVDTAVLLVEYLFKDDKGVTQLEQYIQPAVWQ